LHFYKIIPLVCGKWRGKTERRKYVGGAFLDGAKKAPPIPTP
jgi:hypothetical protein